jgi:cytidylate kinase
MKITLSGLPGSGKSTVGKALAKKLGLKHVSAGDFMREMAKERGISLLELGKIAEKDRSIDEEIDKRTVEFGKTNNNFVMDGRLAWHFIPSSIKVFLAVSLEEGARRIFNDISQLGRRAEEKENLSVEKVKENIESREKSEQLRYKQYYNIDYADSQNYDIVVDTTKLKPEEAVGIIAAFAKKQKR